MPFQEVIAPCRPAVGPLGRLRVLSPKLAGIRSSPLFFGGISLGTGWDDYQPGNGKEASFALLDQWLAAGGVSVDTANIYSVSLPLPMSAEPQDEQSEAILGEWMKLRGVRDRMVVATKYSST